jgi:hypothetical protein
MIARRPLTSIGFGRAEIEAQTALDLDELTPFRCFKIAPRRVDHFRDELRMKVVGDDAEGERFGPSAPILRTRRRSSGA